MTTLQRVGGYAALALGALFVALLVTEVGVFTGMGSDAPPDKALAAIAANLTFLNTIHLLDVVAGVPILLVALAVRERLHAGAPERMRVALITASVGAALFVALGVFGFVGLAPIVAAKDVSAFRTLGVVMMGLNGTARIAFGWTLLLWGWAGLSTKGLPTVLNCVLLLAGVIGVLAFLGTPFGLLVVVIEGVWPFWLGFVLVRSAPMMDTTGMGKS